MHALYPLKCVHVIHYVHRLRCTRSTVATHTPSSVTLGVGTLTLEWDTSVWTGDVATDLLVEVGSTRREDNGCNVSVKPLSLERDWLDEGEDRIELEAGLLCDTEVVTMGDDISWVTVSSRITEVAVSVFCTLFGRSTVRPLDWVGMLPEIIDLGSSWEEETEGVGMRGELDSMLMVSDESLILTGGVELAPYLSLLADGLTVGLKKEDSIVRDLAPEVDMRMVDSPVSLTIPITVVRSLPVEIELSRPALEDGQIGPGSDAGTEVSERKQFNDKSLELLYTNIHTYYVV